MQLHTLLSDRYINVSGDNKSRGIFLFKVDVLLMTQSMSLFSLLPVFVSTKVVFELLQAQESDTHC